MTANISSTQKYCHQCNITEDQVKTGSLKTCAGCKTVYYCSKGCQKEDWAVHQPSCIKVAHTQIKKFRSSKPARRMRFVPEELQTQYSEKKHQKKLQKLESQKSNIQSRASEKSYFHLKKSKFDRVEKKDTNCLDQAGLDYHEWCLNEGMQKGEYPSIYFGRALLFYEDAINSSPVKGKARSGNVVFEELLA